MNMGESIMNYLESQLKPCEKIILATLLCHILINPGLQKSMVQLMMFMKLYCFLSESQKFAKSIVSCLNLQKLYETYMNYV